MIDSFDNAFILDRMFGHDIDVFNNAVLCEVNFGFGSNIPISPHPQNMQLSVRYSIRQNDGNEIHGILFISALQYTRLV